MNFLGRGFKTVEFSLEDLFFRQIRGVQRKLLPVFTAFQVPSAGNYQYIKVAYLVMACQTTSR